MNSKIGKGGINTRLGHNYDGEFSNLSIPPMREYFFGVAKMGERGQIVVPKKARDVFQLKPGPGDSLSILWYEDRQLIKNCRVVTLIADRVFILKRKRIYPMLAKS